MSHIFKYKYVRISSDDATRKNTNADFTCSFNSLHPAFTDCIGYQVNSVTFPNVFYNITSDNNVLKIEENGQSATTITLAVGFYTGTDLITVLKTALDAVLVSGTVVLSLTDYTEKFKFTFTTTTAKIYADATSTMSDILGITTTTASFSAVVDADYIPKLYGVSDVYLESRTLSNDKLYDSKTGRKRPVMKVIPLTAGFGEMNLWESDDSYDRDIFGSERSISTIDIKLTDGNDKLLNLQNHSLDILIKLFY